MDDIFNYIIILIPLAIFIGRAVSNARKKPAEEAAAPEPYVPMHFEEDEEDNRSTFKEVLSRDIIKDTAPVKTSTATSRNTRTPSRQIKKPATPLEDQNHDVGDLVVLETKPVFIKENPLSHITRLPPLKQAVVMAEILGQPKALQG